MTALIKISVIVVDVPKRADSKKGACVPTDTDVVLNNVNQGGRLVYEIMQAYI